MSDEPNPQDEMADPAAEQPRQRTVNRSARGPYRPRQAMNRAAEERTEANVGLAAHAATYGEARANTEARDPYGYHDSGISRRRPPGEFATALLDVPKHLIKPGWDVQWFAVSIFNQPVDSHQLTMAREAGWMPAKAMHFREMVEDGTPDDAPVDRYGQRLYLRPLQMSLDAKAHQYRTALEAQQAHSRASEEGRTTRSNDGMGVGQLDSRVVRMVPGGLKVEGETGTYSQSG